jgi:hypothetical protein
MSHLLSQRRVEAEGKTTDVPDDLFRRLKEYGLAWRHPLWHHCGTNPRLRRNLPL